MNVWNRAVIYVTRKKKKMIQLFGLLFLLCFCILVTGSLSSYVEKNLQLLQKSLGGYFIIQSQGAQSIVDENLVSEVLKLPGVKEGSGISYGYLSFPDLVITSGNLQESVFVQGTVKSSLNSLFMQKDISLIEGNPIEAGEQGKIIISQQMATDSGLSVGDTITGTLSSEVYKEDMDGIEATCSVTVAGIFMVDNPNLQDFDTSMFSSNVNNYAYMDQTTLNGIMGQMNDEAASTYPIGAIFTMDDPEKLASIQKEMEDNIEADWEGFEVSVNDLQYSQLASPLEKINFIIKIFRWGICGICGIILLFLMLMWIKDRKYEIGVLFSIGITKKEITSQLMIEVIGVFGISFVAAILASKIAMISIGGILIKSLADFSDEGVKAGSLSISLGLGATIVMIGIMIIIVSVLAASMAVLRKKPKEILNGGN